MRLQKFLRSMIALIKKKWLSTFSFLLFSIYFFGFFLRIYLTRFGNVGDLLVFAEWGEKLLELGPYLFYKYEDWYFSYPTYPPLSALMYGGLAWIFRQNIVLAHLHNLIKFPPAFVITHLTRIAPNGLFLWQEGYFLTLKLPAILGDLGVSYLIYKIVFDITKNKKTSFFALFAYLFNPVTIFVSSVWGQPESLIAFFGLFSFYQLYKKKYLYSTLSLTISFLIKPTWVVLAPLYLYILSKTKISKNEFLVAVLVPLAFFVMTTFPFSKFEILDFVTDNFFDRFLPISKGTSKASISSFNIHSIFLKIDRDFDTAKYLFISAKNFGFSLYCALNLIVFDYLKRNKITLKNMFVSLFIVGYGSILLLTNMLERYFFIGFVPLVVVAFADTKLFKYMIYLNIIFGLNLFYAFYRRYFDEVDHPFTNYNFLTIRLLSGFNLITWYLLGVKAKIFK